MKLKIVSETSVTAATGVDEEIWVRDPKFFSGYLNNPIATANCMTPEDYFKTGDIGHLDAEGNLWITDRLKELNKYKGFQVPPAELEGILIGHDKVAGFVFWELTTQVKQLSFGERLPEEPCCR
jgi:long-subunit acyl-CoA synthetase (AMP-forming)